jgi:hypothetical protein
MSRQRFKAAAETVLPHLPEGYSEKVSAGLRAIARYL